MAIINLTIVPIGTKETSLSNYVAAIHDDLTSDPIIKSGQVSYVLTAMGTTFEGELDEILSLIRRLHEVPFKQGQKRVMTLVNIDDRRDKKGSIAQKLQSVEDKIHK